MWHRTKPASRPQQPTESSTMAVSRKRRQQSQNRFAKSPLSKEYITRALQIFFGSVCLLACLSAYSSMSQSMFSSDSEDVLLSQRTRHTVEELVDVQILALDAVLVLGGGAPNQVDNPPLYTQARCDFAAAVVHRQEQLLNSLGKRTVRGKQQSSLPILTLSAGTAHLPQLLSKDGLPVWESTSSAAYLESRHNLTHNIFVETTSYDTIGNAFYARTTHTEWNGWKNLLIITSEFHMERTRAIFDWIFTDISPRRGYQLLYLASPDQGLTEEALQARRDKEAASLEAVRQYAKDYRSLSAVYDFLTHQHGLYTAGSLIRRARKGAEKPDALVLKSYGNNAP